MSALPQFGARGVRDPDNICEAFEPGKPTPLGDCNGDGHYMCAECSLRATCAGCGYRPISCECNPCRICGAMPPGSAVKLYSDRTCACSTTHCADCRQLFKYCECDHDIEVPAL